MTLDEAIDTLRYNYYHGLINDAYSEALRSVYYAWDQGYVERVNRATRKDWRRIPKDDLCILVEVQGPTWIRVNRKNIEMGLINGWGVEHD